MTKFEPNKLLIVDENSITVEIRRVYFKYFENKQMTREEFNKYSRVHYTTIIRRLGSWKDALNIAGIPNSATTRAPKISLLEIKTDLERVRKLNQNEYFTYLFYKENGGKYFKSISKRFGYDNWEELLNNELELFRKEKMILPKIKREIQSDEQLFNELKRIWDEFGRRPTYGEFKSKSSIGISIFETRFGNWTSAIEKFCLQNNSYNSYGIQLNTSKELLLQELQKIKFIHKNEILKFSDYKKNGGNYSKETFLQYFGSWKNALELVGLKPGSEWNKAPEKELLFDEIQKIWEELGRQPLYSEWNELSIYKNVIYDRKFGGWKKAIYEFIADRENEDKEISEIKNFNLLNDISEIPNIEELSQKKEKIIKRTPRYPGNRLRFTVLIRDNFCCQYCGKSKKEDNVKLEIDHIIAYSNGGETILENLITACWACNSGKSNLKI